MGLAQAWRKLWEQKASAVAPLMIGFGASSARLTPRRYDRLAEEGFRSNVVVYRCVKLVAQCAAAVPWLLYEGSGARKREIERHNLLDLLERPNPTQAGASLFESLFGYFLIAGNSYLEAVGGDGQAPRELWVLRPDRMTVIAGARGLPNAYRYSLDGRAVEFPVDAVSGRSAVLHVRGFHPLDDWYGLSPLEAAALAIDQHNAAGKWNAALLQNGARPAGALVYAPANADASGLLTDAQRDQLKREIEEQFSGAGNAGRPLVLEGGLEWREMALNPKDMDWRAAKDLSAREIAQAFHVPPQLLGIEGSLTFANFEQARLSFYEDAVLPLLDLVKDELNRWLVPRFGTALSLDYDPDQISALMPRRREKWDAVRRADFLTVNEKRAALGYAPIAGGDEPLLRAAAPTTPTRLTRDDA